MPRDNRDDLYLLDGYSLIYRSYFAFIRNPLRNARGENTSAIFGFFRSLFLLFKQYEPAHFCVVLDSRGPTFRHEQFPEYKGTRDETPQELKAQIPIIEEICSALGVPMVRSEGYEADDCIATLVSRATDESRRAWIVSGDKDLLQLVSETTTVLKPDSQGFVELTPESVPEQWGVSPAQIVDYLALVGDSVDNVPGVRGIGKKTAEKLLGEYETLDGIYEHAEDISAKGTREKLLEGRENAFMSRELVTLAFDAPMDEGLLQFAMPEELHYDQAIPFFEDQGMSSLIRDLRTMMSKDGSEGDPEATEVSEGTNAPGATRTPGAQAGAASKPPAAVAGAATAAGTGMSDRAEALAVELGALNGSVEAGSYACVTDSDALERWIRDAETSGRFAFDSETDGLDSMQAQPVGFSLCVRAGQACYIPLKGPDGEVLDAAEVRQGLKTLLENPSHTIIGQNLQYDYKIMKRWGVDMKGTLFDTLIAAWLLEPGVTSSYGMDKLATTYLGYSTIHYDDVVPKAPRGSERATFDTVDLTQATDYAAEDADITFRLGELFTLMLEDRGLTSLATELDMPLIRVLAEMEYRGIGLNSESLARYSEELVSQLADIEAEIYRLCGHEFNISSTQQLQKVLFEERGLTPKKKTKTGYSTDTSVLEELAAEDPVPELVLQYRGLSKLKSTYVEALPKMVNPETQRLHTSLVITGTATGRIASRNPNLQNIPIREEAGRRIRDAFVPAEGNVFVSADYSQIELVVLAHLSADPGLTEAFESGKDVHAATGSRIFGVSPDDVSAQQRRIAKTINFGVMYGMSAFRLARDLRIPRKEADAFIESYFSTYSRIRSFVDECVASAKEKGFSTTLLGRRRPIPELQSRNRVEREGAERIAVNTPIQGSAADIVKKAMLNVDRVLREENLSARLILQVHDELMIECPLDEVDTVKTLLGREMTNAVELSVPLKVQIESGSRWGEFH